ncbi:GD13618 [Drosophila simulans]|uniref:Fucosyltransferase n=1 Tax=Drosophila simulans TaxID=7240 RepID=B4QM15_DROSI|nr:GD13618 [Drosophila simulans]
MLISTSLSDYVRANVHAMTTLCRLIGEKLPSVQDFATPQDLILHLKDLANNPLEYRRYFWWHSIYRLRKTSQPYCALCSLIQQAPGGHEVRQRAYSSGFINWWTKYQCPNRSTTFL